MIWSTETSEWYSSDLGQVCQEADEFWYFYPVTGGWTSIPYGPMFPTATEAIKYAESRVGWIQ